MNKSTASKLWTGIGSLLCLYCIAVWIYSQGLKSSLSKLLFESVGRHESSIYGVLLSVPLLLLLYYLTNYYAMKHGEKSFISKFPIFFDLKLDLRQKISRHFQWGIVILFMIFPLIAQVHFVHKFFRGTAYNQINNTHFASGYVEHLFPSSPVKVISAWFDDSLRYDSHDKQKGATYLPIIQPWFLLLIETCVFVYALIIIWRISKNITVG